MPQIADNTSSSSHIHSILCPLESVRSSCHSVVSQPTTQLLVQINTERLGEELEQHTPLYTSHSLPPTWAQSYHYCNTDTEEGCQLTVQYIFVLDALNFCFWHNEASTDETTDHLSGECSVKCRNVEYEYDSLASSLKRTLLNDSTAFSASRLQSLTLQQLHHWLQPKECLEVHIPLLKSRVRALNELGAVLQQHFDGLAVNMVKAAQHSASRLVQLITAHLTLFRDSAVYNGEIVYFYKRAQILVGDLHGGFEGQGYGYFNDLHRLTCFADYRLPQLMNTLGIILYSNELQHKVDKKVQLESGSSEEIAVRASTVVVVEMMVKWLKERKGIDIRCQQLDWILWERGEANLKQLKPHHRVRTIFY